MTGGWQAFQAVLEVVQGIARKHDTSIAAVAIRYVLNIPGVSSVIIGSTLTASSISRMDELLQAFRITLDEEDERMIAKAQHGLKDLPGGCGDEYRKPPFLTASGDLTHHLDGQGRSGGSADVERVLARGGRIEYSSGSQWEPIAVSSNSNEAGVIADSVYRATAGQIELAISSRFRAPLRHTFFPNPHPAATSRSRRLCASLIPSTWLWLP